MDHNTSRPLQPRVKALGLAMKVVGLICLVGFWPLTRLWPSGWTWPAGGSASYLTMIIGIYATLGVFLLWGSQDPVQHLDLVWFSAASSLVHAVIMTIQAVGGGHDTMGHLYGDVPALFAVAAVLGVLAFRCHGQSRLPRRVERLAVEAGCQRRR